MNSKRYFSILVVLLVTFISVSAFAQARDISQISERYQDESLWHHRK